MPRIIIRWKPQFAGSACKFDVYLMNTHIGELRCGNAIAVTADVGTHLLVFKQKLKIGKKTDTYFEVVVNDATEIVELKTKFDMNGKFTVSYADNAPHIPAYAGLAADNVSTAVNEAQYKQYTNAMNEQLADMNKQLTDIKKKTTNMDGCLSGCLIFIIIWFILSLIFNHALINSINDLF